MDLAKPVFKLDKANPNAGDIPDQAWWLWLMLHQLEPKSELGGIYAAKRGFHSSGAYNQAHYPDNYSIRDTINRSGLGWTKASALDWTFPDAQSGKYATIDKYTSRLLASAVNPSDPRLDLILFEFYGQADNDSHVEGYNEFREDEVTSDSSHLWHIHMSFVRSKLGSWWGMWALFTVLAGWSVTKWRDSLPDAPPKPPAPKPTGLPHYAPGVRTLRNTSPDMKGTDVQYVQRFIGTARCGPADGVYGAKTESGVRWYQRMRGISVDGVVGPQTWRNMGVS